MESAVETVLGPSERGWLEFLTDPVTNSPVLLFHYPSSQPGRSMEEPVLRQFVGELRSGKARHVPPRPAV